MREQWKRWTWGVAFVACLGLMAGCPITGNLMQTVTGEISAIDDAAETITVTTATGDVVLSYAGVPVFLPGDSTTPSGDATDLAVGVDVTVRTEVQPDTTVIVNSITIAATGGPIGGGDRDLGQGELIIPEDETTLIVDGSAFSRDADLGNGSIDWYIFAGTAGTKYDILARGNAPVVISVYRPIVVTDGSREVMAAVMLWTTDPEAPEDVFFVDSGLVPATKSAKAVRIPSFVAPEDGDYYVSVQAAQVWAGHDSNDGFHFGHVAYYDVRSYTVQVSTVPDPGSATALLAGDPALNPAFSQGAVTIYQGDWFYFDGEADSNYMIEFRPMDPEIRYTLKANVYAPDGSIACTAYACSECKATSFYSPVAERYLVRVTLDPEEESPLTDGEIEWGQAEYLIRILDDDHGNYPPFATPVTLEEGAGAVTLVAGHLSTDDADVFGFTTEPYRTYRLVTDSDTDVLLQDFDLNQPAFDRNLDAIGNEDMLIQNDTGWPEERLAGVLTLPREFAPGDSRNTFGLLNGPYELRIISDDHVDDGAPLYAASPVEIGAAATGVLWGDTDRDTDPEDGAPVDDVFDTDLFSFVPAIWPIWHRVDVTAASMVTVGNDATVEDDTSTEAVEITTYYESTSTSQPVPLLIGGPDPHQPFTAYTADLTQEDHANRDGNADRNAANAAVLADGEATAGVLWGAADDDDIFQFTAAPNRTYRVSVTGATGRTSLGGTDNVAATYDLDGNNRAITVRHAGMDPVVNIVQVSLEQETDADIGYNVQYQDDDFVDAIDPMELDDLSAISGTATEGVLFKGDTDLFRFTAEPNMTYRVSITGANGPTLLSAPNTVALYDFEDPENDRAISVRHNGMDAETIVVTVGFDGEETDITYNVAVVGDDHVDSVDPGDAQAVAALTLLGAAARTGTLYQGDTDSFRLSATMGTMYEISPANNNIVLSINGVPVMPVDGVYPYTHAVADDDVIVQVTQAFDVPEDTDVDYSLTAVALP